MIPDIPEMTSPSLGSSVAFVAVIGFVAIAITAGVWRGGPAGNQVTVTAALGSMPRCACTVVRDRCGCPDKHWDHFEPSPVPAVHGRAASAAELPFPV